MTSSSEVNYIDFNGDGSTVTFAFPFKIFQSSDLKVYLRQTDGLVATLQVLDTDYSVSGVGVDTGGSITFDEAPTSSYEIVIYREPPLTQEADIASYGKFSTQNVEDAFDKLNEQILYLNQRLDRCLKFQDWSDDIDITFTGGLSSFANKLMQFNGTATALLPVSASDGSADYVTAGSSTTSRSLSERFSEVYNIKDWGATGDGTTDDTAAIQACINAAPANSIVYFPADTYLISTLNTIIPKDDITIMGYGAILLLDDSVTLNDATGTGYFAYDNGIFYNDGASSIENFEIHGLTFKSPSDANAVKVDAVHMGDIDSELTSASHTGIKFINCKFEGRFNSNIYCINAEYVITNVQGDKSEGNPLYVRGGQAGLILGGNLDFIGVSDDYSVWNNVGAVNAVNSSGCKCIGLTAKKSGGSMIAYSIGSLDGIGNQILFCDLDGCGQSAITIGGRSGGTSTNIKNNMVFGNNIKGWLTAPSATSHIGIFGGSQGASRAENEIIAMNNISFLASWESFNTTSNEVEGNHASSSGTPYNDLKQVGNGTLGSSQAIGFGSVSSVVGSTLNPLLFGNNIWYAPVGCITLQYAENPIIEGNKFYYCNWHRDGSDNAYGAQHLVSLVNCLNAVVKNNIGKETGRGVNASSNIYPYRLQGNINAKFEGNHNENSLTNVACLAWLVGASGSVSFLGYSETASIIIGENSQRNCSTTDGGVELIYIVNSDDNIITFKDRRNAKYTASRTISPQFSDILLDGATALSMVLRDATQEADNSYTIYNIDAALNHTITPTGSDTIAGGASYTLNATKAIKVIPNGTNWEVIDLN